MNIFHEQPTLTDADIERITPHLSNNRAPLVGWLETYPPLDDLKRAVMVEILRAKRSGAPLQSIHRGVLVKLIKMIQKREWSEIDKRILKELKS